MFEHHPEPDDWKSPDVLTAGSGLKILNCERCLGLKITMVFFMSSSFFWFSRASWMVFTSCCTLVTVLPILATLWNRKNNDGVHFWNQDNPIIKIPAFVDSTFWSSSTVAGRLTKSAADFKLAFKWLTVVSSNVICKDQTTHITMQFLATNCWIQQAKKIKKIKC